MCVSVFRLGPLWAQSAFWYEDYNGDYKKLFNGTQNVTLQIVTNVISLQKIPEIARALVPGTAAYNLYDRMTAKCHHASKSLGEVIVNGVNCIGKMKLTSLTTNEKAILENYFSPIKRCYSFGRIFFGGTIIESINYTRVTKRNSFTVMKVTLGHLMVMLNVT